MDFLVVNGNLFLVSFLSHQLIPLGFRVTMGDV